jgi:transcriptional regulator with XRE-family HTH domain
MDEIRRIRKERGLSQQRLAELAGVDKVTIVHIEGGKVSPKVETLEKLARALDVEVADFFPKAQEPLLDFSEERRELDATALDEDLAKDLRQQTEFRLQELNSNLEQAGDDQEQREKAYRNLKNWWVWFLQPIMTVHKYIPEIPGPALLREGDITAERVREFGPGREFAKEQFRTFEEALKTDVAHEGEVKERQ